MPDDADQGARSWRIDVAPSVRYVFGRSLLTATHGCTSNQVKLSAECIVRSSERCEDVTPRFNDRKESKRRIVFTPISTTMAVGVGGKMTKAIRS